MKVYDVANLYQSLKLHFTKPKHDHIAKPLRLNRVAVGKRKDLPFLQKLARHNDPHGLILANILHNPNTWPLDLIQPDAERVYLEHQRRLQSLTYTFTSELGKLRTPFDDNIKVSDGTLPPLFQEYIRGSISLETLTILCDLCQCYRYWDKRLKNDPLWEAHSLRIIKYRPFLPYDKEKFRGLLVDAFADV